MRTLLYLGFFVAVVTAEPAGDINSRIIGGAVTTINQYPFVAATLYSANAVTWSQACAGSIITNRALLSSAACYAGTAPSRWRIRVGSSFANSGGVVHNVYMIVINPSYNAARLENDIAVIRSSTIFTYNANVNYIAIANTGYNLPDSTPVWALGWGRTGPTAAPSEQLRLVQIWTVNANVCRNSYISLNFNVSANMICTGWQGVGGRGQCQGDNGGPLVHFGAQRALVGVFSWGQQCGSSYYPDINTRVSEYVTWIRANA